MDDIKESWGLPIGGGRSRCSKSGLRAVSSKVSPGWSEYLHVYEKWWSHCHILPAEKDSWLLQQGHSSVIALHTEGFRFNLHHLQVGLGNNSTTIQHRWYGACWTNDLTQHFCWEHTTPCMRISLSHVFCPFLESQSFSPGWSGYSEQTLQEGERIGWH